MARCTPGSLSILHSTPPATQRASLSRSGDLTVASFIKIIDSGHQDSQYLATLTFDATAGAAQDECPASPSPTVVGWMATRMAATPTTVARWMPVPIAVPLAAVGAREEVAPHCVTDLGDYACRQVLLVQTFGKATARCGWTQKTPPIWLQSPQCADCNHVGGRSWRWPWRRPAAPQDCAHAKGSFRTILHVGLLSHACNKPCTVL